MHRKIVKPLAGLALAGLALATAAGTLTANVTVKVRLQSSSGVCGAVATAPAVAVSCHTPQAPQTPQTPQTPQAPQASQGPRGPLLPEPGAVPYQRVGTIAAPGVMAEPLPLYSDGTKVTSWRVVTLDNARYVELTIIW